MLRNGGEVVDLGPALDQRQVGQQPFALRRGQCQAQFGSEGLELPVHAGRVTVFKRHVSAGAWLEKPLKALLLQMDEQKRDRGRRDARDPGGLAERLRTMLGELLAHLKRQRSDLVVVQLDGQRELLQALRAGHFFVLLIDVAGVLGGDFELLDQLSGQLGTQLLRQCFT